MKHNIIDSTMHVEIPGNLTATEVDGLSLETAELFEFDDTNVSEICLDISLADKLDSMGLTYLVGLCRTAKHLKWRFHIYGANPDIVRQISFANLVKHFNIATH